ncbi:S5A-reductase domain-containing protein [Favolaschia claudopus]|uniref:S5A-reductase domain-containing protein n=1 Tax=Favolaschia claudopus TaxID=2862362 RepID=A0AAV9ZIH2_9AGAR
MSTKQRPQGPFQRENPNVSLTASIIFALGRLADAPFQYLMFREGWAVKLLAALGFIPGSATITGNYEIPALLIGMYAIAGVRHAYWIVFTNATHCSPASALNIAIYNASINLINTLVAVNALTSPSPITYGWKQWMGIALFAIGILLEVISETSRKHFKKDPRNKGRIDDTGLWSIVRHPNYLGYLVWRIGLSLTAGSLTSAIILNTFQFCIFYFGGIPDISGYMARKYDAQWAAYTKRVPSAMCPLLL